MNNKLNCLVVGCGGIGGHHLVSLAKRNDVLVYGVDLNSECLNNLEQRLKKEGVSNENYELHEGSKFVKNKEFKLGIIATPSRGRAKLTKDILSLGNFDSIILEKLLSPNLEELEQFETINNDHKNVQFYVNCPRRIYPFYLELKEKIRNCSTVDMVVEGGKWNLGSNGIHLIDLYSSLIDQNEIRFDSIQGEVVENLKHKGYDEFNGEINFTSSKGKLKLISREEAKGISVSVYTEKNSYFFLEGQGQLVQIGNQNVTSITVPYQSSLTSHYFEEFKNNNLLKLVTLKESLELHQKLFYAFRTLKPNFSFT